MHSRMRHRVTEFLKILNRAKQETVGEKERKTITYVAIVYWSLTFVANENLPPSLLLSSGRTFSSR